MKEMDGCVVTIAIVMSAISARCTSTAGSETLYPSGLMRCIQVGKTG